MTRSHTAQLDVAIAHLDRGELSPALDELASTWAAFKSTRLSEIIAVLGERVLDDSTIEAEGYAAFVEAHASLKSPSAAARSVGYWRATRTPDKVKSFVTTLQDNPFADPRTTRLFLHWHANPPSRNAPFWREAVALIRHHVDPACWDRLEAAASSDHLPGTTQRALQGRIGRALARTAPAPEPTEAEAEQLDRIEGLIGIGPSAPEVLDGLYLRPPDLERLSIWADHLIESGDPRGEFVQLQLRHGHTPLGRTAKRRMKELEARHRRDWLACFGTSLNLAGCEFRNGIAHRLAVTTELLEPCEALAGISEILLTQESGGALYTPLLRPDWVGGVRTWQAFVAAAKAGATSIVIANFLHDPPDELPPANLVLLDVPDTETATFLRRRYGASTKHLILRRASWEDRRVAQAEAREWPSAEVVNL